MALEKSDRVATPPESVDRRRSQRIPLKIPLIVVSLDPYLEIRDPCVVFVTVVSYHGCQFIAPRPFKHETLLALSTPSNNRHIRAHVIRSIPVGPAAQATQWIVGVEFDTPGNYWDVETPPPDWRRHP